MRPSLELWISDANALRQLEHFRVGQASVNLDHVRSRADDYYISLVGELFELMRTETASAQEWALLGNAFAQFAADDWDHLACEIGVPRSEAALFAAAAFYCGGFPASAYVALGGTAPSTDEADTLHACFDLLARPAALKSQRVGSLRDALLKGDMDALASAGTRATVEANAALHLGPNEWIGSRLFEKLVERFLGSNIRAVLPGGASEFWTPLVRSLVTRQPSAWEFFPSQIEALNQGLLEHTESFSLQMPTGAGKTTLCETLLFWHAKQTDSDVAVLLVPYRSLASELRATVVRRLNSMHISARCAYGGTVPTGDEVRALDDTRVIVATPEALSGLLGVDTEFLRRISLVICDEGHLLDSGERGVSLELLLARMRARECGAPRFVFVSAIVPNIEEINAWLGGTPESVVKSDYRPALAEYAVLRPSGPGAPLTVDLDMHPHESPPTRYTIGSLLTREDFRWTNPESGRSNTYPFRSVKTQAIATARKALSMGASVVFAANKRGDQGAIGLAEELLRQLDYELPLCRPLEYANPTNVDSAVAYLRAEYGPGWVGTKMLTAGAVLHHGDIPQETREVVEVLLRRGDVRFAICTNTLAEGVNLPIRTLVLYSVRRHGADGRAVDLPTRDIKNLVGRAGRAGATTKGLVVCANPAQWSLVEPVARQSPGKSVKGALRALVIRLQNALAIQKVILTNALLEGTSNLHSLTDGIDATLVDLAAEEIGEEDLVHLAIQVADETFAAQQLEEEAQEVLREVFRLRAQRVVGIRSVGRLGWVRETGARMRLIGSVEGDLLPLMADWNDVDGPLDPRLVTAVLDWAWAQNDVQAAVRDAYQLADDVEMVTVRRSFYDLVEAWLAGGRFVDMAERSGRTVDETLGIHARALTYVLQTHVEQGIALLDKLLESQGLTLAGAVKQFPNHLRFGVPDTGARILAEAGVRHRHACVCLGIAPEVVAACEDDPSTVPIAARETLLANTEEWQAVLGSLVFQRTLKDLTPGPDGL